MGVYDHATPGVAVRGVDRISGQAFYVGHSSAHFDEVILRGDHVHPEAWSRFRPDAGLSVAVKE